MQCLENDSFEYAVVDVLSTLFLFRLYTTSKEGDATFHVKKVQYIPSKCTRSDSIAPTIMDEWLGNDHVAVTNTNSGTTNPSTTLNHSS